MYTDLRNDLQDFAQKMSTQERTEEVYRLIRSDHWKYLPRAGSFTHLLLYLTIRKPGHNSLEYAPFLFDAENPEEKWQDLPTTRQDLIVQKVSSASSNLRGGRKGRNPVTEKIPSELLKDRNFRCRVTPSFLVPQEGDVKAVRDLLTSPGNGFLPFPGRDEISAAVAGMAPLGAPKAQSGERGEHLPLDEKDSGPPPVTLSEGNKPPKMEDLRAYLKKWKAKRNCLTADLQGVLEKLQPLMDEAEALRGQLAHVEALVESLDLNLTVREGRNP